jgi:membrane-bound lytic murein transglycosylase D
MTIMVKNAKDYDLEGFETDPPLEYENLKVTSPTHLTLIADVADRPVSDIRELNPALLSNVAPANYEVHIPKGTADMVMAGLQSVPENRRASWRVHRLAPGDTLESIARQYNMPVKTVTEANAPTVGNVGDIVVIPASLQEAKSRPTVTRYGKPIKGKASSRTATAKRNSGKSGKSSGTPAASFKSTSKRASLH